jgi:hypothetical protein
MAGAFNRLRDVQGRKITANDLAPGASRLEATSRASVRFDSGTWREAARLSAIPTTPYRAYSPGRCDKFEMKLTGKGPCTILSMMREFSIGSEV